LLRPLSKSAEGISEQAGMRSNVQAVMEAGLEWKNATLGNVLVGR